MADYMRPTQPLVMYNMPDRDGQWSTNYSDNFLFNPLLSTTSPYPDFCELPQQYDGGSVRFATSFDPLLQNSSIGSAPSSYSSYHSPAEVSPNLQHAAPAGQTGGIFGLSHDQSESLGIFTGMKQDPLRLDTHLSYPFPGSSIPDYGSYNDDATTFSVDPAFIQQASISDSLNLNPPTDSVPNLSQPPSLSPSGSGSDESSHQWTGLPESYNTTPPFQPSPVRSRVPSRQASEQSLQSLASHNSANAAHDLSGDEGKERTQCPHPDCGKMFKDLKAHMLTHQNERPEKCPIVSCDFHKRGFARKYDRNRHLITTHYKTTVVCGFCPGEGSTQETSFNRADIFKKHLVSKHGCDQNSSVARKRTSRGTPKTTTPTNKETSGRCTTCGNSFPTPQALFDHLDDCILAVVTKPDACESINERNLRTVVDENAFYPGMQHSFVPSYPSSIHGVVDDEDADDFDDRPTKALRTNNDDAVSIIQDPHTEKISELQEAARKGAAGLSYSKGGVNLNVAKGRRKKKHYPQSWGCSADDMTLKKRVMCVFDGQRRLVKDDMMLGNEFHQRIQLPDGGYVTDLDVETLKRAEAFHNTTEAERGPWIPSNYPDPTLLPQDFGSF